MNLPDLYARVVAKRPDLAASVVYSHIIDVRDGGPPIWGWFWQVSDGMGVHVHHSIAAALILARWVEALPVRHSLDHHPADNRESEEWQVRWYTDDRRPACGPCATTPLEALAAFYLGDSQ